MMKSAANGHPDVPRLIAWEVTRACPLNCRHCRAAARKTPSPDELSRAECFAVLDNIATLARPIIILTGGEPMLRADVYDIASHARELGMPVVMAPCGLLLDDEAAGRIVRSGVHCISISLDGATPASHDAFRGHPGSFEACLAGIEAARRAGLDFQVNTVVSRHNLAELSAILDLAVSLGASVFNPFMLVPTGRGRRLAGLELSAEQCEQTLRWLAGQRRRKDIQIRVTCAPHYQRILRQCGPPGIEGHSGGGCLGGKSFAFISHVGKVQICGFLDVECGDLRREGWDFKKIWASSEVFLKVRDVDAYHGRCGYCDFRGVCGGCRARAYAAGGDWLAADPLCLYQPPQERKGRDELDELDDLDKGVLSIIQTDFPVADRPFDVLAERAGGDAGRIMERIARLRSIGVIRRLGAVFDSRALGYASTLVAARIPPDRLKDVAETVNQLPGVTHNYRRDHAYNLWFTLTGRSGRRLRETVEDLKRRTGIGELFMLPALAVYKVRVDFRIGRSAGRPSGPPAAPAGPAAGPVNLPRPARHPPAGEAGQKASRSAGGRQASLNDRQKDLVRALQEDLPLVARPFSQLAGQLGLCCEDLIEQIKDWLAAGVIRRFGAVVDHRRLGFKANGMAVFRALPQRVDEIGRALAQRAEVSHCFRRPALPDFDFNLYAMVHGRSVDQVRALVAGLAGEFGLDEYAVLFSTAEYKKTSMKYFVSGQPA